jgi:TonB family protein
MVLFTKNKMKTFLLSVCILCFATISAQITNDVPITNIGGKAEFKRVFEQQLQYPESALKKKVGGIVIITFTVNKDSSAVINDYSESGAPELNYEAMRLFRYYKWLPATRNGVFMKAKHSVTFEFNPDKYSKICKERGYTAIKYLPKMNVDTSFKIYNSPEQFPMYPKGNYALQDFIKENLEYPRQAQLANIQGTVMLRFIVEPSGLITNIQVEKSVGGGCDQEAIRILQLIKWYPGKVEDKLVRVNMTMPFYFILNDEFKDNSVGEQK